MCRRCHSSRVVYLMAGIHGGSRGKAAPGWLAGFSALVWAGLTSADHASWLGKPFQLHWPALCQAGDYIQAHPEQIPRDARIMRGFPGELRVTSDRTMILMPRN